uniref:Dynein regulatory complex protein 10 n=1 Tax=Chromera velia CCMP2878 TaxID=1169474 RepID=A0A0G4GSB2_9ALVE|eukprot:Cvel_23164.t1-p1 / transcript=Cvel_23164.t1 / gene=Cvel_23164 / organism=Chromera_velia_CCMP2878 / gene_product=IQ domain-containing protein D, putative / transcript_product=IQ domain-containing protein D, putative / location=Cvel_scaffold2357:17330-20373(-) / protein_length=387 / sequence_SO=supercontig / SO=protein_coding / is_pseudo=false
MPSSKPTNVDAQRVLAIMEELIKKLTYLSMIDQKVVENLRQEDGESTAAILGPELVSKIEHQIQLELYYEKQHTDQNGVFSLPQDEVEMTSLYREQIETLQKNTRELCRMMDSQEVIQALRGMQENKNSNLKELASVLHDMQAVMEKKLTTTVEEDNSRREVLEQHRKRAEHASKRKQELDRDLALVHSDRDKSQAARKEKITKLKADLDDVQHTTQMKLRVLTDKYDQRGREHRERFQKREAELSKIIEELGGSNSMLRTTSVREEEKKRKDKRNKEIELQRLIGEYDLEMLKQAEDQATLEAQYAKELQETLVLREQHEKLEAEHERQRQEKEIEEARATLLRMSQERRAKEANTVQAWWRGVKQREEFMKMKKQARKKGKGKKK